jgi:hypothetical protein
MLDNVGECHMQFIEHRRLDIIILTRWIMEHAVIFVSYHTISHHIIYHIISYHIIYIIPYHIISYHVSYIIPYHITSIIYHIIPYHITSYHISYHTIHVCIQMLLKTVLCHIYIYDMIFVTWYWKPNIHCTSLGVGPSQPNEKFGVCTWLRQYRNSLQTVLWWHDTFKTCKPWVAPNSYIHETPQWWSRGAKTIW